MKEASLQPLTNRHTFCVDGSIIKGIKQDKKEKKILKLLAHPRSKQQARKSVSANKSVSAINLPLWIFHLPIT